MGIIVPESAVVAASDSQDFLPTTSTTEGQPPAGQDEQTGTVVLRTRFRGLSWDKKHQSWRVRIYYGGRQRHVGRFQDELAAAQAYDKAAIYLYGNKAITNFGLDVGTVDGAEVSSLIVEAKASLEMQRMGAPLQQQQQHRHTHSLGRGRWWQQQPTAGHFKQAAAGIPVQLSVGMTDHPAPQQQALAPPQLVQQQQAPLGVVSSPNWARAGAAACPIQGNSAVAFEPSAGHEAYQQIQQQPHLWQQHQHMWQATPGSLQSMLQHQAALPPMLQQQQQVPSIVHHAAPVAMAAGALAAAPYNLSAAAALPYTAADGVLLTQTPVVQGGGLALPTAAGAAVPGYVAAPAYSTLPWPQGAVLQPQPLGPTPNC